MTKTVDYEKIMNDRKLFNETVYTPLSEALRLLDERKKDKVLIAKVEKLLKGDIPEVLTKNKKYAILFRQVATPNHETRRFISIAEENDLYPVIFEFHDDKFTSNNEFKHSLGQLRIKNEINQKRSYPAEKITIVDFAKHDGKKLRDVLTLWKEPLIDFHKKLFTTHDYGMEKLNFYDASSWLKNHGEKAVNYYPNFFLLCICHGILFENYLLHGHESAFTKNIILSALEKVMNLVSLNPLIVPIEPLDIETDERWISHHPKVKSLII